MLPEGVCTPNGTGVRFAKEKNETWYLPMVHGPILAFDIETTGLSEQDTVTCVCAYDPDRNIDFRMCTPDGSKCDAFVRLLDEAPALCAFNGVKFDVPFLSRRWGVPPEQARAWVCKLVDPYESCKLALQNTFSLDRLLEANGLAGKTGNGKEAVIMARECRWEDLKDYCMADTVKTHQVVKLSRVRLPDRVKRG